MIRNLLIATLIAATAVTAFAAVIPAPARHMTVIEKNQAFPVVGPLVIETCAVEDCSGTPS